MNDPTSTSDLPRDKWLVVAEQDMLRAVYLIRIFKINSVTKERQAWCKDGTVRIVSEGSEIPVYLELSEDLQDFLEVFSNVYVIKQVFERLDL